MKSKLKIGAVNNLPTMEMLEVLRKEPQRAQELLQCLKRRTRRFTFFAIGAGVLSLMLSWEGKIPGAIAFLFLAAMFFGERARSHSDSRLLEVLIAGKLPHSDSE
ncbi:MAG TPA: hypothetical protein VN673_06655 [Clostridia bacterium]|nr:hypothetical protein [Clostridia bacterium]